MSNCKNLGMVQPNSMIQSQCNLKGDCHYNAEEGTYGYANQDRTCCELRKQLINNRLRLTAFETWLPKDSCFDYNFHLIGMFRDPIARIQSHIRYEKTSPKEIPQVLDADVFPSKTSQMIILSPASFSNMYIRSILGQDVFKLPISMLNETHLQAAKSRILSDFSAVMTLENYSEDMLQVFALPGFPSLVKNSLQQFKKAISIKERATALLPQYRLTPDVTARLIEANRLDLDLYEFVKKLSKQLTANAKKSIEAYANT